MQLTTLKTDSITLFLISHGPDTKWCVKSTTEEKSHLSTKFGVTNCTYVSRNDENAGYMFVSVLDVASITIVHHSVILEGNIWKIVSKKIEWSRTDDEGSVWLLQTIHWLWNLHCLGNQSFWNILWTTPWWRISRQKRNLATRMCGLEDWRVSILMHMLRKTQGKTIDTRVSRGL